MVIGEVEACLTMRKRSGSYAVKFEAEPMAVSGAVLILRCAQVYPWPLH